MNLNFSSTKNNNENKELLTVNQYIKIKDIRNDILYTTDGFVITFLKVYPQNSRLKTYNEQVGIILRLASNFSTENSPFSFYITNKPVDVSKMTDYQIELMNQEIDPQIQSLLAQRIEDLNRIASSGMALEKEVYIKLYEKVTVTSVDDLDKRKNKLMAELQNSGFNSSILTEQELQQLIDTYNNPETSTEESQNYYHLKY